MANLNLLDLKSVPCPLNFVKIKLALENLSPKEELIVELDKGEPEEIIYKNLKGKGFIIRQLHEDDYSIKIKILHES